MTTERWTDGMLDELAGSVGELRESVGELRESVEQTTYNVELLVGAVAALIENDREHTEESRRRDREFQQYKLENDQRFNVLLEEVRFLIRQLGENR